MKVRGRGQPKMLGILASVALIIAILVDAFEAMVLPRRVAHRFRLARTYYHCTWSAWSRAARLLPPGRHRAGWLGVYGPFSLLSLMAGWMLGLMFGFGLLHWSIGTELRTSDEHVNLGTYLYMSGTTLSTLGFGDVVPAGPIGRALSVVEAALGFGFLACVIGYLPVLYQAFSRREVTISLLDARAGSPPTAVEGLTRAARAGRLEGLVPFLAEWERWAAELLESQLSFPVLSYYRSQHDNQSWLAALTAILDTSALVLISARDRDLYQAQLTFAMARHTVVDLSLVYLTPVRPQAQDRLSAEGFRQLVTTLRDAGLALRDDAAAEAKLMELRGMYEPFVEALSGYFLLPLPPLLPDVAAVDNWQTSAWMRRVPGLSHLPLPDPRDEHFD